MPDDPESDLPVRSGSRPLLPSRGGLGVGKLLPTDDAHVLQLTSIETRDPLPHWRWSVDENVQASSVSRRTMLKGVGAGAAIAWSTPILSSLRTPAFAQGSPPPPPGCDQNQTCFDCPDRATCHSNDACQCWLVSPDNGSGCFCGTFVDGCDGAPHCDGGQGQCAGGTTCVQTCCGQVCVEACSSHSKAQVRHAGRRTTRTR
jgi:hypothetical protein